MEQRTNREGTPLKKDQKVLRYEEAASVLPVRLRKLAMALPDGQPLPFQGLGRAGHGAAG